MLLHGNVRPHVAQQTEEKLNELKIETVPHPPYSPDLSPTDYHFSGIGSFLVWKIIEEQRQSKSGVPGIPRLSYIGLLSNWNSETCFPLGKMYSIKGKLF